MEHYIAGFGRKIAAEKHNITINQLSSQLYRMGIQPHNYNKVKTPDEIELIKMQRMMGKTYKSLATQYGISVSTIRRYCLTK